MAEVTGEDVLLALQHFLNERRMRGSDLFKKFDSSGDGQISTAEFRTGLAELDFTPSEEVLTQVLSFLDSDGSGEMSLKELDRSLRQAEKAAKAEGRSIEEAARKCGLRMQGAKESKATQLRRQRTEKEMAMKKSSSNQSLVPQVDPSTDPALLKIIDALNERKSRAIDYFRKWDISGDNNISVKEFRIGLAELNIKVSEPEFTAIMARLDKDGSGDVSIIEFDKTLKQVERAAKKNALPELNTGSKDAAAEAGDDSIQALMAQLATANTESAAAGEQSEPATPKSVGDPWRVFACKPLKKPPAKPVTIGVAPSMCKPPAKPPTPPLWASILGVPDAQDTVADAATDRSTVSVRQVMRPLLTPRDTPGPEDGYAATHPAPLEERQRVEWRLKHLQKDMKLRQVSYKGLVVPPGKNIPSQSVNLAGVQGCLRFWPNGYFNFTQSNRFRGEFDLAMGGMRVDSWCAVGLFMPPGTHLKVRFFVGEERSELRECYWSDGSLVHQIWMPEAKDPPANLEDLVVGVEVFKNCRHLRPKEAKPSSLRPSPRREMLTRHLESLGVAPERPSHELPHPSSLHASVAASSPPKAPKVHAAEVNGALRNVRTEQGLALPSPRFMCSNEMRRMPPRCDVARALLC